MDIIMAKTETPAFDPSALKPVVADLPTTERAAKPNPFTEWLADSYAEWSDDHEKGGRKVDVPAANATEVKNLIRRAADRLEIGSRVVVQDSKGKVIGKDDKMPTSGNVTILYCGRDRKARKSSTDETATA